MDGLFRFADVILHAAAHLFGTIFTAAEHLDNGYCRNIYHDVLGNRPHAVFICTDAALPQRTGYHKNKQNDWHCGNKRQAHTPA